MGCPVVTLASALARYGVVSCLEAVGLQDYSLGRNRACRTTSCAVGVVRVFGLAPSSAFVLLAWLPCGGLSVV